MNKEEAPNINLKIGSGTEKIISNSLPEDRTEKVPIDGSILNKILSEDNIPRLRSDSVLFYKSAPNVSKISAMKNGLSKLENEYQKQMKAPSSGAISFLNLDFGSQISDRPSRLVDPYDDSELKISPMVRSKSSFFIHMNYENNDFINLKTKSSMSLSGISETKSRNYSAVQLTNDAATPSDAGFLIDLESKGFHGIWSNAITRLYFLQYLIWNRKENLMALRLEIIDYRSNFHKLSSSLQIAAAKRIRKFFLLPNSLFRVDWSDCGSLGTDLQPDVIIDRLNQSVDTPDPNTFDILGYLAYIYLEKLFYGEFFRKDETNMSPHGFDKSPFYQLMQTDLRGTLFLTTKQYRRAVERVLCVLENQVADSLSYEKIITILEAFCLEQNFIRKDEKKIPQNLSYSKDDFHNSPSFISPSIISPSMHHQQKYEMSTASHAFLAVNIDQRVVFCEYCFELSSTIIEELKLYSCETCGVYIHKCCRSHMTLSCVKTSFDGAKETNIDVGSEALRIVTEKLSALQKEIDIELQIQQGLEKIIKAKKTIKAGSRKSPFELDIAAQLEKNSRRLDCLKHEMQKRNIQLQNIHAHSELSITNVSEDKIKENDGSRSLLKKSMLSKSLEKLNDSDPGETGLLRVLVIDPITKSQFKKAVCITENQSTIEVIDIILSKSNIVGHATEFSLSYKDSKTNEQVILKGEDKPTQIEDLNYANTLFYLKNRKPFSPSMDDLQMNKQLDIAVEIIDSELKYTEDLKLINSIFIESLSKSDIISKSDVKDLFINISDIIPIHERICSDLSKTYIDPSNKISNLINCYLENLDQFSVYEEYCGSQYQQRELLKRLTAQNLPFSKFIQKCEQHQKLHKLTLLDMLMKPMQKITRYPLLLKRLLLNLQSGTDFDNLTLLINNMEQVIFQINENVRHMESRYRIKLIDKTLEFGLISDKFKIAIDARQLLMENTVLYVNEKSDTRIEIVLLLFNDMLLITRRSKKVVGGYVLYKPPIPLENALFIDHADEEGKKMFQIAHLKQEIHTLETYSAFDKKSWLQEAEAIKTQYIDNLKKFEHYFVRNQVAKWMRTIENSFNSSSNYLNNGTRAHDDSLQSSYKGSSFFKASIKKQADDVTSIKSNEESSPKKANENHGESQTDRSPTTKFTSEDLLNFKKKVRESYFMRKESPIQNKFNITDSFAEDKGSSINCEEFHSAHSIASSTNSRKRVFTVKWNKKEEQS